MKGGQKTVGVLYNEGFALLKSKYKAFLLISLAVLAVTTVAGTILSAVTTPVAMMLVLPLEFLPVGLMSSFDVSSGPSFYSNDPGFFVPRGDYSFGWPGVGTAIAGAVMFFIAMVAIFAILFLFVWIIAMVQTIIAGTVGVEATRASLVMAEGRDASMDDSLKSFGKNWKRYLGITAWTALWTSLWSLLLIVPGIIKGYSYRLAPYLVIQYPGMKVRDALKKSMETTSGYKGRLFGLDLILIAFGIGAAIVSCFFFFIPTLVASVIWITPLSLAMFAVAYLDIKAAAQDKGLLPSVEPAKVESLAIADSIDEPGAVASSDEPTDGTFTEMEDDSPQL